MAIPGGTDPVAAAGAGSGSGSGPAAGGAAASGAAAGGAAADVGGHLLFRAGGVQGSTHSFLAAPPEPGTMWLFPGGLPHCVMPFSDGGEAHAGGPREPPADLGDRISVAVNFEEAAPPLAVTSVLPSPVCCM